MSQELDEESGRQFSKSPKPPTAGGERELAGAFLEWALANKQQFASTFFDLVQRHDQTLLSAFMETVEDDHRPEPVRASKRPPQTPAAAPIQAPDPIQIPQLETTPNAPEPTVQELKFEQLPEVKLPDGPKQNALSTMELPNFAVPDQQEIPGPPAPDNLQSMTLSEIRLPDFQPAGESSPPAAIPPAPEAVPRHDPTSVLQPYTGLSGGSGALEIPPASEAPPETIKDPADPPQIAGLAGQLQPIQIPPQAPPAESSVEPPLDLARPSGSADFAPLQIPEVARLPEAKAAPPTPPVEPMESGVPVEIPGMLEPSGISPPNPQQYDYDGDSDFEAISRKQASITSDLGTYGSLLHDLLEQQQRMNQVHLARMFQLHSRMVQERSFFK